MSELIAERLRALRAQRGWPKEELARRFGGKNRAAVYLWERGKRTPSAATIRKLAEIFTASGHGTVTVNDIDPKGEAFVKAGRTRTPKVKHAIPGADRANVASSLNPPPMIGGAMNPGELLAIPDVELFRKVLGKWLDLDEHDRRDFVDYARAYSPRRARRKNA